MNTNKFSIRIFVFLILTLCLLALFMILNNVKSSEQKKGVAWVSYTRVLNESSIMQQEKDRAEKIALRVNEAERLTLQKIYDLPEPLRREIRNIQHANVNNTLRVEAGRTRMISHNTITDAVEKYRVKNHYSMVYNKDQAASLRHGQDISEAIIDQLQGIEIDYGALPDFKTPEQTRF